MKAKDRPRFDVEALRDLAGEKVFARGEAYYRGGQVEILAMEPARVVAQVVGTEDYRTVLTGRSKRIGGECSCPAFEDRGFCKHMVAVALAANAAGGDAEAEGAGTLARIRRHLKLKSVDALVEMIVDLAERDAILYRKLGMAAATSFADDRVVEASLRKAIDTATRIRGFVEYSEAGDWAAGVVGALDAVAALVSSGRGGLALKLVDHAFLKIEAAIQGIDDSDGHCGALLSRAREIHFASCKAARPDPVKLAGELFTRETNDQFGIFHGAAATYTDVLGEAGLAEYRRRATEAWEKLPPRFQERGVGQEQVADYDCLKRMLDFFAERDGDVETRIALRAKDLSSPWKYLELAEFCLSQGREQEALSRAEEGLWIFEDEQPDERLVGFAVKLLVKRKRKADAEALLWRAFEKAPSLAFYGKLRLVGGAPARERAIAFLETRLAKEKPSQWHFPSTLLIQFLMEEKMFDRAWQIARQHGASPGLAEALARASEASHPAEALEVYTQRVEEMVVSSGGYEEASRLVVHMARLRSAAEQAAYVGCLKERYRRRRNFMKLLG
jgi:hypothetical protein